MPDKLEKFKHNIKTPLSTIAVAVDSIKPFIQGLILEKENKEFDIYVKNITAGTKVETILKLLGNIEFAVEQINTLTDALK